MYKNYWLFNISNYSNQIISENKPYDLCLCTFTLLYFKRKIWTWTGTRTRASYLFKSEVSSLSDHGSHCLAEVAVILRGEFEGELPGEPG